MSDSDSDSDSDDYTDSVDHVSKNYKKGRRKYCKFCDRYGHDEECFFKNKKKKKNKFKKNRYKKSKARKAGEDMSDSDSDSDSDDYTDSVDHVFKTSIKREEKNKKSYFVLDSGASFNYVNDKKLFKKFKKVNNGYVHVADGSKVKIKGIGKVSIGGNSLKAKYVPSFTENLLSIKYLLKHSCNVNFHSDKLAEVEWPNGYVMNFHTLNNIFKHEVVHLTNEEMIIHTRLGHPNFGIVKKMVNNKKLYSDEFKKIKKIDCNDCEITKITRKPFGKRFYNRTKQILEIIHMDLVGPVNHGEFKYSNQA